MRYSDKYSVGLTGGIGSGKSTVAKFFAQLEIDIIDADKISRDLTQKNALGTLKIAEEFGHDFVIDGQLNRTKIRDLVFNQAEKKQRLESILHPLIRQVMKDLAGDSSSKYIVFDIPLLIEGEQMDYFDQIICVNAPKELRYQWIKQREEDRSKVITDAQIQKIMDTQATDKQRIDVANYLIENNESLESLKQKVHNIHYALLSKIS